MSTALETTQPGRRHSSIDPRREYAGMVTLLALIGAIWLLAIVVAGASGMFEAGRGRPPLALLAALVVPPALFLLAYRVSAEFRRFVLGRTFLFLYAFNLRPALFAFSAGLGDLAVGVAAVFVLLAMIDGHPNWRRRVLLLSLVPTFMVPLWIIIHCASLLQLRQARGEPISPANQRA